MINSTGVFVRQSKVGYFARVEIQVETGVEKTYFEIRCKGNGFRGQGYIEEVPENGYEDWKFGAIIVLNYALRKLDSPICKVTVIKIEGLTSDTNPTIVAAAAINALWKAYNYVPNIELQNYIEEEVLRSWALPQMSIPYLN
ncbi:MAG TPA: hypothetical protein VH186_24305 [Chloroflexia bacterium]|nr:hypothetical protein [Chloroflexia bacterium]